MVMRLGQCTYLQTPDFPAEITQYNLTKIQQQPLLMAKVAVLIKEHFHKQQVTLPVIGAPLLRAIGIEVTSDWHKGIQLPKYRYPTPQSLSDFTGFELNEAVLAPLFEAITILKTQGETVVIEIPGAFAIFNALINYENIIISSRKNKAAYAFIMAESTKIIQQYLLALDQAGCDYIYFADAVGGVELMGPRFYKQYYAPAMLDILSVLADFTQAELLLCPRAFVSLQVLDCLKPHPNGLIRATSCVAQHFDAAIGDAYTIINPSI